MCRVSVCLCVCVCFLWTQYRLHIFGCYSGWRYVYYFGVWLSSPESYPVRQSIGLQLRLYESMTSWTGATSLHSASLPLSSTLHHDCIASIDHARLSCLGRLKHIVRQLEPISISAASAKWWSLAFSAFPPLPSQQPRRSNYHPEPGPATRLHASFRAPPNMLTTIQISSDGFDTNAYWYMVSCFEEKKTREAVEPTTNTSNGLVEFASRMLTELKVEYQETRTLGDSGVNI